MKNKVGIILNGLIKENPTFVLVLGMCPTLATTTSAINGIGMGLATAFVLIFSNMVISLIKNLVPDNVRIPSFIVVIATFVTILELVMQAYLPALHESLGLFIPLIVVNCIVLGRAEAFASKNSVLDSALDGIGMGLGFTFALGLLGMIRELLGAGTLFGLQIIPEDYGMLMFILAPGAFVSLAYLIAIVNRIRKVS
ncbi:MAG: RnfABCDGE type electron transport complex subunit E [Bacteroidales bacterium]|jgi:electron transport complex protein RnfE|nr:electron transport complex subunit E [Bacteroidales bacterium]MDI9545066.1 electron transport complex subunit E [Bacteroidota bacterium]OQC02411.1 MAG: Electron transport complex protein RnfE [Bacteroidetes bacterium ADurb.Bin090]MBP8982720.1 electron transport complex subunit E [Bacteroidales bacterium]HNZ81001.1 electron transport complex subunit E [Bacteroidales bacterium]